ncbi:MAG: sugar ABC transporter substrate-binding protein [Anaerolineae bacterium]|nr:sugar ABC transporter substrate-binding protein [Anaerolineae bacterium]
MSRKLSRRGFLGLGAMTAGMAALSACGAAATPQVIEKEVTVIVEGTPQIVKETVIVETVKEVSTGFVTLRAPYAPGYNEREMFDLFEALYDEIKVLPEETPGGTTGYEQRTLADIAAGTFPDVWYVHPNFYTALASRDALLPVNEWMVRDNFDSDNLFPAALDVFSWRGDIHGLPYGCNTQFFVYNKGFLGERGMVDPNELESAGNWNWTTLLEELLKATGGEGLEATLGVWSINIERLTWVCAWIWSADGNVYDEALTRCLLDEPEAREALQYLADMFVVHKVAPAGPVAATYPDGFNSGRVAYTLGARVSFYLNAARDNPLDLGCISMPVGPRGSRFTRGGWDGFAIPRGSPHPEEAWKLLQFLVGDDCQKTLLKSSMPFTHSIFDSEDFVAVLAPGEDIGVYRASVAMHRNLLLPGRHNEVDQVYRSEIEGVKLGEITLDEAIPNIVTKANEILAS